MALHCTIAALERMLLEKYPASDAEKWDRTGLLAGNPEKEVTGVAVALDPTVDAVMQAKATGANVLLTHHPVFLQPPEAFMPCTSCSASLNPGVDTPHEQGVLNASKAGLPGAVVFAALDAGIALMNFHTALDMNEEGLMALPTALGLSYVRTVLPLAGAGETGRGYGALCQMGVQGATSQDDTASCATVSELARRCKQALGGCPRIWGNIQVPVQLIVTAQGAAGSILSATLDAGASCLICGELKYHDALAYTQRGLNIIELGHDVSERPLAHVLYQSVCGFGIENVVELPQEDNWVCLFE